MAGAKKREAEARETAIDTQAKVVQMNAMARAAMQPNSQMPPIVR
jgi:hypothetical protein